MSSGRHSRCQSLRFEAALPWKFGSLRPLTGKAESSQRTPKMSTEPRNPRTSRSVKPWTPRPGSSPGGAIQLRTGQAAPAAAREVAGNRLLSLRPCRAPFSSILTRLPTMRSRSSWRCARPTCALPRSPSSPATCPSNKRLGMRCTRWNSAARTFPCTPGRGKAAASYLRERNLVSRTRRPRRSQLSGPEASRRENARGRRHHRDHRGESRAGAGHAGPADQRCSGRFT